MRRSLEWMPHRDDHTSALDWMVRNLGLTRKMANHVLRAERRKKNDDPTKRIREDIKTGAIRGRNVQLAEKRLGMLTDGGADNLHNSIQEWGDAYLTTDEVIARLTAKYGADNAANKYKQARDPNKRHMTWHSLVQRWSRYGAPDAALADFSPEATGGKKRKQRVAMFGLMPRLRHSANPEESETLRWMSEQTGESVDATKAEWNRLPYARTDSTEKQLASAVRVYDEPAGEWLGIATFLAEQAKAQPTANNPIPAAKPEPQPFTLTDELRAKIRAFPVRKHESNTFKLLDGELAGLSREHKQAAINEASRLKDCGFRYDQWAGADHWAKIDAAKAEAERASEPFKSTPVKLEPLKFNRSGFAKCDMSTPTRPQRPNGRPYNPRELERAKAFGRPPEYDDDTNAG
jgi:hypothetical protein